MTVIKISAHKSLTLCLPRRSSLKTLPYISVWRKLFLIGSCWLWCFTSCGGGGQTLLAGHCKWFTALCNITLGSYIFSSYQKHRPGWWCVSRSLKSEIRFRFQLAVTTHRPSSFFKLLLFYLFVSFFGLVTFWSAPCLTQSKEAFCFSWEFPVLKTTPLKENTTYFSLNMFEPVGGIYLKFFEVVLLCPMAETTAHLCTLI